MTKSLHTTMNDHAFLDAIALPADLSDGRTEEAQSLYKKFPKLRGASVYSAAATGSPEPLKMWIKTNRALASTPGGPRQWQPLSYLCFSRLLLGRLSKKRRREFAACARLLLRAGADPNTYFVNPSDNVRESVLYGASGTANNPLLTRILLNAGANVDDNETLYHTAEFKDHTCLRMILAKRPKLLDFCMCHKMDQEDARGVQVFLDFGADPNILLTQGAGEIRGLRPLHFAILRGRSRRVLQTLIKGGADPRLPAADGTTPYVMAMRFGRRDLASLLQKYGGASALSPGDAFIAACAAGDTRMARRLLKPHPELVASLSPRDAALLPRAAAHGQIKLVNLLLELGFPLEATGGWGGTALHEAAWSGHVALVRLLVKRGARLDIRQNFGGDVMHTAIHGAIHAGHNNGIKIVQLLAKSLPPSAPWESYLKEAQKSGQLKMQALFAARLRTNVDKEPR